MRGKHRKTALPVADATASLDDADLAEIFLRLRSPATLALAALVSRRWRRVAYTPAFLRRFRRLHPPPLLGFFVCNGGRPCRPYGTFRSIEELKSAPLPVLDPTFVPVATVPPPPRDVGGAVGRLRNFSLSSIPDVDHWALADAHDGLLLLCSSCERSYCDFLEAPERRHVPRRFAVGNPLSGSSVVLPQAGDDVHHSGYYMGAALLTSDGDGIFSFEVLVATYFSEPSLSAFSSRTGQWAEVPCPCPAIALCEDTMETMPWIDDGARANGCIYWVVDSAGLFEREYLLVLDTRAKEFSAINLPSGICAKYERNIRVMRSDDGELRVVAMASSRFVLHFWRHDRSRSTRGRWVKEDFVKFVSLSGVITAELLTMPTVWPSSPGRMIDAGHGLVFMKRHEGSCVFVLDLKEMKLHKLPNREKYSGYALPYRMALSPPLPNFDQGGHH